MRLLSSGNTRQSPVRSSSVRSVFPSRTADATLAGFSRASTNAEGHGHRGRPMSTASDSRSVSSYPGRGTQRQRDPLRPRNDGAPGPGDNLPLRGRGTGRDIPVTTCQMVAEERVEPYEVRTCQMVAEERVQTFPSPPAYVAEERVEPYEVRTCEMVAEERVGPSPSPPVRWSPRNESSPTTSARASMFPKSESRPFRSRPASMSKSSEWSVSP